MEENKLAVLVEESGIEKEKAKSIWIRFEEHFKAADEAAKKVSGLEITDVSQTKEMKLAREVRLELQKIRVAAKKTHDALKEDALKEGRFIDHVNRLIVDATTPIEKSLLEKEKFAERKEEARIKALYDSRAEEIRDLGVDPIPYPLGQMSNESYDLLVDSFRVAKQAREEAARKAAEEQAEELRKKEAEAAAARAELDRIERERREAEEEEQRRIKEEQIAEALRQEAILKLGDKGKLTAFLESVEKIEMPEVDSSDAEAILDEFSASISGLKRAVNDL